MKAKYQKVACCTDEGDRELLRRFKSGDETAFDELLAIHLGYINYWLSLALERAPWAQAGDLRQEAYWGFFEAVQHYKFSTTSNFHALARISAWRKMFESPEVRIVHRSLYENHSQVIAAQDRLLKRLDRMPTSEELAKEADLSVKQVATALKITPFHSELDENDEALASRDDERLSSLNEAIAQLRPAEATVVIRQFQGDKLREIAESMDKSVDAVKKLHQRAKEKLKDLIGNREIRADGI